MKSIRETEKYLLQFSDLWKKSIQIGGAVSRARATVEVDANIQQLRRIVEKFQVNSSRRVQWRTEYPKKFLELKYSMEKQKAIENKALDASPQASLTRKKAIAEIENWYINKLDELNAIAPMLRSEEARLVKKACILNYGEGECTEENLKNTLKFLKTMVKQGGKRTRRRYKQKIQQGGTKQNLEIKLFHAKWCGHCTRFMPQWRDFVNTTRHNVNISEHEMDDGNTQELMEKYKVSGFPTVVIAKDGQDHHHYNGERSAEALEKYIAMLL